MSELALKLIAENKKTRATFLDLGNCGLTEVPDEIGDLVWLEELSFANEWLDGDKLVESQNTATANNIAKLSPTFVRFKQSTAGLGQLTRLKKLWLNGSYIENKKFKLSDLRLLANLNSLQQLNISNTKVTDLSPLAKLSGLQWLYVSSTQVTDLSPLVNLSGLQWLYVSSTQVTDLSPLVNLHGLQLLDVSLTEVTDLSPLANLSGLQLLDVSDTSVTDLSPLANLSNLQRLDASHTRVTELSPLLGLIENNIPVKWASWEDGICVENCPLTNPPVAIVQQGNEAILNYFHEKQSQGIDHLYEAKLLLVGEGGAGKTSLLRRLYQPEQALPAENETTKGIAIYRHEFNVIDNRYPNGRTFRLNVWDFGGQEIYHATHQFFLTQRSLYILLDDTRKDDKTVHDDVFKYWLDAVDLLSSHSPVLIFQNEKGGRSKTIDLAGIKGKFDNVNDCYRGNLEQADAADKLRDAIELFAKQLPHIGEELPKQWLSIRAEIEQLAERQATITLQEYFKLYQQHLPFDRRKALLLSRYLHDLGVFLHFQDDDLLMRTVILQNQWATEAVFKMLDDEQVKAQLGRFSAADCQRLWLDSDYADMHPELLALMQKFELCYLLPDTLPKLWLAPQLLPPSKPAELNAWATAGDLVLRYRYEFLPKGMINRLMVRLHRFVPRPELGWLTGVLFERDGTKVLVEIPAKGGEIVLRAKGLERKELLSVIAADLDALNETFKGLPEKVSKLVPCNCGVCIQQTEPKFFEHKDLLRRKKVGKTTIECPASFDNVNVLKLLDGIQVTEMPDWSIEQTMKKIFISYSKKDIDYKDSLINHLTGLRGKIVTWNDRDILPGEEWDKSIKEELRKADIVLYLVSADSMATDYIQQVELPMILQHCDAGECKLVPIIVRACDWEEQGFAKYNALPMKGKPIKSWADQDEAWLEVVKGIKKIIA